MNMIRNLKSEILHSQWSTLSKHTYEIHLRNGEWAEQIREAYDSGNGAAILLYNKEEGKILLTRQFRLPTFISGNEDGMMIEVCAGLLDADDPAECVRRETEEETGYRIQQVEKVMEAYMSPGAVTEILYLFVGAYTKGQKVSEGGGLEEETEDIEVLEYTLDEAMDMIKTGEIKDAKTILLLQHAKLTKLL
jgi:nudix-type nucleoside diphosphatase (YffH/AdpP family)